MRLRMQAMLRLAVEFYDTGEAVDYGEGNKGKVETAGRSPCATICQLQQHLTR